MVWSDGPQRIYLVVDKNGETKIDLVDRAADRLRRDLTTALSALRQGDEPEDVRTGSDIEPGVYLSNDEWIAWDYLGEDIITITRDDIARRRN